MHYLQDSKVLFFSGESFKKTAFQPMGVNLKTFPVTELPTSFSPFSLVSDLEHQPKSSPSHIRTDLSQTSCRMLLWSNVFFDVSQHGSQFVAKRAFLPQHQQSVRYSFLFDSAEVKRGFFLFLILQCSCSYVAQTAHRRSVSFDTHFENTFYTFSIFLLCICLKVHSERERLVGFPYLVSPCFLFLQGYQTVDLQIFKLYCVIVHRV